MSAIFCHFNFNVLDLKRSVEFYDKALGLREARRVEGDGFTLVYLTDGVTPFELELTYLFDREERYDLGEDEFHLAMRVKDYEAAHALHEKMGCVCFENTEMGLYFIEDPDGYWIEILPET
ncbi:VOC family protein [Synergistes jonesii]|uniref:VOC family protein n=1 Tax=Synergistes jonesii TaxID=2754 RepID=UPI00248D96B3|nr:VOC family protein [Synergistes jonesii]